MMNGHQVEVTAAPPEVMAKAAILNMLDAIRRDVESGSVVAVFALPITPDHTFTVQCQGIISSLALSGAIGKAWLTINELIGKV